MLDEIKATVNFFGKWLQDHYDSNLINQFKSALENHLYQKCSGHWYPNIPLRGQAYRAILIDEIQTDPMLMEIAENVGITNLKKFETFLPRNCVIFLDPYRVVCKNLTSRENLYHIIYQENKPESNLLRILKEQEQQTKSTEQQVIRA